MEYLTAKQRRAVAVAVRRVRCAYRGAGQLMQPCGAGGMVAVAVGDEDKFNGTGTGECLEVGLVQGTRINHDGDRMAGAPQHVGVGAGEAHGPGVGGQDELRQG